MADLLAQLRTRLQDDRWSAPAFSITCLDRHATDCLLDIANNFLRTTVVNGAADAVDLVVSLVQTPTDTIGGLAEYIQSTYPKQYRVVMAEGASEGHSSADIESARGLQMLRTGVTLRTRRFSDKELTQFLEIGCRRHNPNYRPENVPSNEAQLVLTLAHVEGLRVQATDAAKRRGLDSDVNTLMSIANSLEQSYQSDVRRLAKAILPLRTEVDAVRDGDVVIGDLSRLSFRTGRMGPGFANVGPQPVKVYDFHDRDVEDHSLTLRWRRSSESYLYTVEVWRDTQPDVRRAVREVGTSADLVWSSRKDARRERDGWGTSDAVKELVTSYIDGMHMPPADQPFPDATGLEPDVTYYYRIYVVDRNGEWAASDVVSARTKRARAYMRRGGSPFSTNQGPAGTVITITGKNFTDTAPRVFVGPKVATTVVDSDTQLTVTIPAISEFTNPVQDIVIRSNSGLSDVFPAAWTYTS